MSDPTSLAERALVDIHAMRNQLSTVVEGQARMTALMEGLARSVADQKDEIRGLTSAREVDRDEVAKLRLEVAQYKAANALPMRAVIALGALILLAVGGVVVNNAVKPPAPQIIVQQPVSAHP